MCDTSQAYDQLLFSYGTLQLPAVQLATFGRLLAGSADLLPGFRLDMLEITDPQYWPPAASATTPSCRIAAWRKIR